MDAVIVIAISSIFFIIIGGAIFMVYLQLRKTDPKNIDKSILNDIDSAQDFLPFQDIKDGAINMGGHNYRVIIECSSTNYNLKTDMERNIIEASFQRFLNSLTFPITFFIQTRAVNNNKMLEQLRGELLESIKVYPQVEEYANVYFEEMSNLSKHIENNKQKKKYIIIPYNEAVNMEKLSDIEKYEFSVKEAKQRALILIDGLASVGVKAVLLNTSELVELIYSTYYKDNYSDWENIVNGEYFSLIVNSEKENIEDIIDENSRLDWILYEAQMRIKNEFKNKNNKLIKQLQDLRDAYVEKEVETNQK